MDFAMTDEQELLLESVREFCDRYFTEDVIKEMYETGDMPDEIAEAYRDAGFGLMGIPEEYGGIPCDKVTLGMMIEELYHSSGCNHILYQNSLTAFDIVEFGTPEQIQKYMDAYMETGWPLCSLSISEPGAGSDNRNMSCTAKKQDDGTYRLNGQKTWGDHGGQASVHHRRGQRRRSVTRERQDVAVDDRDGSSRGGFPRLACIRSASSASRSARCISTTWC